MMATSGKRDSEARSAAEERMAARLAAEHAPGAVPPTEGVPPRSGAASHPDGAPRSASDDLADALDLLRRAARKAVRDIDPRLEQLAERAAKQLRELDEEVTQQFGSRGERLEQLERVAEQVGSVIASAVESVAQRIERAARPGREP
jgi:hypothetical protein